MVGFGGWDTTKKFVETTLLLTPSKSQIIPFGRDYHITNITRSSFQVKSGSEN
jgi:hypothetical protein